MPVLQGCFKCTSQFGLSHEAETVAYYNLRAFVHNYHLNASRAKTKHLALTKENSYSSKLK